MKIIKARYLVVVHLLSLLFPIDKYESKINISIIPNYYNHKDIALILTPDKNTSAPIIITCLVPDIFNITDQKSYDLYLDSLSNKITFELFSAHDKNYFAYQYVFEDAVDTLILYSESVNEYIDSLDINILGRYKNDEYDKINFNINFFDKPVTEINVKFFPDALENDFMNLFKNKEEIQNGSLVTDNFTIPTDSSMSKISLSYNLMNDITYDLDLKQSKHIELFSNGIRFMGQKEKFEFAHVIILSAMCLIFFILSLIALIKFYSNGRVR